jgi:signal transduction histidine kinase
VSDAAHDDSTSELSLREAALNAREGELLAEWESLRYVLLAARMATWEYDIVLDQVNASPSALAYLGLEPSSGPRSFGEFLLSVHPDDRSHVAEAFSLAFSPVAPDGPEFRVVWPDGSVHWIANKGRVWRDATGEPRKMVGLIYSIDERKRDEAERLEFERRLQHQQKLESLALLAGGVAHDFNNLLVGILGNANLMALDLPPDDPNHEAVAAIETSARRAADLVRQMLSYTGRSQLVTTPVDCNALCAEMRALLGAAIPRRIALSFELAHEVPKVLADATQLRQVVMNLVTNAADAIGEGEGVVLIRTGTRVVHPGESRDGWVGNVLADGHYVVVEVSDNGVGMDATTIARMFDPFFTTKFVGRGLGLAATMGIVRAHHGGIHVESVVGKGTTIRVALPQASARVVTPPRAVPSVIDPNTPLPAGTRVLVIDDEEPVRQVATAIMTRAGGAVLCADDASHALALLDDATTVVHAIFLDHSMPGLDGVDAARAVRRARPETPIILTTGHEESRAAREYTDLALSSVLRKPFVAAEFLSAVHRALAD